MVEVADVSSYTIIQSEDDQDLVFHKAVKEAIVLDTIFEKEKWDRFVSERSPEDCVMIDSWRFDSVYLIDRYLAIMGSESLAVDLEMYVLDSVLESVQQTHHNILTSSYG